MDRCTLDHIFFCHKIEELPVAEFMNYVILCRSLASSSRGLKKKPVPCKPEHILVAPVQAYSFHYCVVFRTSPNFFNNTFHDIVIYLLKVEKI